MPALSELNEHERRAFSALFAAVVAVYRQGGIAFDALTADPTEVRHHEDGGVSFAFEGLDGPVIMGVTRERLIVLTSELLLGYDRSGELREALSRGPRPPLGRLRALAEQRAPDARWC